MGNDWTTTQGNFRKGNPGGGRPKGSKNRFTKVKEAIVEIFDNIDAKDKIVTHLTKEDCDTKEILKFVREIVIPVLPKDPIVKVETKVNNYNVKW